MQINVGLIELKNDWIVRGFRRELTRFPRLNVGQSIDGQSAWALRPFFVFCCFFFFSSSLFLTKPRRESNANRQAVAKIFSFSPFLFFFFSLSLARVRSLSFSQSSFFLLLSLLLFSFSTTGKKPPLKNNSSSSSSSPSSRRQHTDKHMRRCYLTIDLVFLSIRTQERERKTSGFYCATDNEGIYKAMCRKKKERKRRRRKKNPKKNNGR